MYDKTLKYNPDMLRTSYVLILIISITLRNKMLKEERGKAVHVTCDIQ